MAAEIGKTSPLQGPAQNRTSSLQKSAKAHTNISNTEIGSIYIYCVYIL